VYVVADGIKQNPVRRWSLPERVFFACGACHILAYAFLKAYPQSGFAPLWIKPAEGFTGNHIVVVRDDVAFDYHGFSRWSRLLGHIEAKARRWWPGWSAQFTGEHARNLETIAALREEITLPVQPCLLSRTNSPAVVPGMTVTVTGPRRTRTSSVASFGAILGAAIVVDQ
jgi:hypothetical protein